MYEGVVQDLIDELGRLPGVGPKSAQRIAFHLLQADSVEVSRLVNALVEVKEKVRFCSICGNVAEAEQCRICSDPRRYLTYILSLIHISEPTRQAEISYAVFCLKTKTRKRYNR